MKLSLAMQVALAAFWLAIVAALMGRAGSFFFFWVLMALCLVIETQSDEEAEE